LFTEIVARCLKNLMRGWMRQRMKDRNNLQSRSNMNRLTVATLNLFTGNDPESAKFWEKEVGVLWYPFFTV